MPQSQTIKPAVYKIDLERVRALTESITSNTTELSTGTADKYIALYHDDQRRQGLSNAKSYELRLDNIQIGDFKVSVYSSQSNYTHPWSSLFGQEISDLFVSYPNLAAFIFNSEVCYAISVGQGHALFEQFVNRQFPLDMAKRIMTPSIDSTNRREISGAIYGQIQQFRTSQRVSSSQTLGTVWSGLSGKINDDIRASYDFKSIFEPDRKEISVEAGSALLIKRSIEVTKLPALIRWIEGILSTELTIQQEKDFGFMDGLSRVSLRDKSKKRALNLALAESIRANLGSIDEIDFDFAHKNFRSYQDSLAYNFGSNSLLKGIEWESPPSVNEVIKALKDNTPIVEATSDVDVLQTLEDIRFYAVQAESASPLGGSIIDYLHGEVEYDGSRYFLVDGVWYQASTEFLKRLTHDFKVEVEGEVFTDMSDIVPFDEYPYSNDNEGGYNRTYTDKNDWIVADETYIERVEIADLIHWRDGKLYLIHNKMGYGSSARDVCSQVSLSMSVLNSLSELPDTVIQEYYNEIVAKHYSESMCPLSEEEFAKLLKTNKKDIVYVIGYIRKTVVSGNALSSIAKYETVKIIEDSKLFGYTLRVRHIPKPN